MDLVYLNGELTPQSQARLPVTERGFLYGDGLFETVRIAGGRPFLLARHLARLADSATFFGLPLPDLDWDRVIAALAGANHLAEGAARLTLTRGTLPPGPSPAADPPGPPTVLIQARPLPADLDTKARDGATGRTLPFPLRAEGLPLTNHKHLGYTGSVVALGRVAPGEEPILETTGGHLCETATANLFWVTDGVLYTPGVNAGCLPGVCRAETAAMAGREGLDLREGLFPRARLAEADEAFTTNAARLVTPLVSLDGRSIGAGAAGPLTCLLQDRWTARLAHFRDGGAS